MSVTSTLDASPSTPLPAPAEPQPADPSAPRHFDFVDALRGLAIVGVMMIHSTFGIPNFHGRLRTLAAQGQFGVQLFFVVSAFTLFWSLRSRRTRERRPLLAFFTRRFFRLAPLFWVGIAFYLCVPVSNRSSAAPNGVGWPHVLATLAFVHGWYPTTINSVVPGGWSIGAEAMFYLCIPVLFARVRTLNQALWLTLVAAWVTAALAGPVQHRLDRHFPADWGQVVFNFVFWSFPSQLPVFCLGIVLYFLLVDPPQQPAGPRVSGLLIVAVAAMIVFGTMGKQVLPSVGFVALAVGPGPPAGGGPGQPRDAVPGHGQLQRVHLALLGAGPHQRAGRAGLGRHARPRAGRRPVRRPAGGAGGGHAAVGDAQLLPHRGARPEPGQVGHPPHGVGCGAPVQGGGVTRHQRRLNRHPGPRVSRTPARR